MTKGKAGPKNPAAPQDGAATSGDVAAWGEQWLSSWIAESNSADERATREWLAEGWRAWSLEAWAHGLNRERHFYGGQTHSQHDANFQASQHLRLYEREPVGLLVWRAFGEYRARGEPVPEIILAKFDKWASRLERASGAKGVAAAIEMTGEDGGPQGAAYLAAVERQRRIVSAVELLKRHNVRPMAAQRRVAAEHGLPLGAVKSACSRWRTKWADKAAAAENATAHDLLRMLGRR